MVVVIDETRRKIFGGYVVSCEPFGSFSFYPPGQVPQAQAQAQGYLGVCSSFQWLVFRSIDRDEQNRQVHNWKTFKFQWMYLAHLIDSPGRANSKLRQFGSDSIRNCPWGHRAPVCTVGLSSEVIVAIGPGGHRFFTPASYPINSQHFQLHDGTIHSYLPR